MRRARRAVKATAMSNSSSMEPARRTPACLSSASVASSLAASAPVCEDAARAPTAERPALSTMIGFFRVTRGAMWRKLRALPKFSTYMRMTSMAGSSSQCSSRSLPLTSALLPIETNCAMPMPSSRA